MDIELLTIQQDAFSLAIQSRNQKYQSKMEQLTKESNYICQLICTYQIIKTLIFLAYYEVILNSPLHKVSFLVFIQDAITFFFYMITDALTFKFNYQSLFMEDQVINIFHLNHSLIYLTIQEVLSLFKPFNGIFLLYKIQQKSLFYPLLIIRILHYFVSTYYLYQFITISQENCLPIKLQISEIIIYWIATIIIMIILGVKLIINIIQGKQILFEFQSRFIATISEKFSEMKYIDVNQSSRGSLLDCPICYQEIKESDTIIQLPCHQTHLFHSQCCKQWLFQDLRCPICRVDLEPKNKYPTQISCN